MSAPLEPFAVQAGEGVRLQTPPGDFVYVKTNTLNTHGSLTVLEFYIAPLSGPALMRGTEPHDVSGSSEPEKRGEIGCSCRASSSRLRFASASEPPRKTRRPL